MKESCFAWKILYHIPTIYQWYFQGIPNSEIEKQCKRCKVAMEDNKYCLWDCVKVQCILDWVLFLVPLTSLERHNRSFLEKSLTPRRKFHSNGEWLSVLQPYDTYGWIEMRMSARIMDLFTKRKHESGNRWVPICVQPGRI